MADPIRAALERLIDHPLNEMVSIASIEAWVAEARAALATEADGPAVPEGREPAAVVGEPSDEELLELMPATMRDEFSYAAKACADATGNQVKPGIFRVCLNTVALEFARAVLARWGRPAPPADEPAVPDGREPASVAMQPSDEDLWGLDQLEEAWNAQADAANNWNELGLDEIIVWAQRQALFRWGHHPLLPAEAEVGRRRLMAPQHHDYTEIDNAICRFLDTSDGAATSNKQLCAMAERMTGGEPWRLIDRRMQAMRKSGRIKFIGRKHNHFNQKLHGWVVADSSTSGSNLDA